MVVSEIKIGGFGGQGVILTGIIVGRAASIYDEKFATMTQAFGPEARGSACSSQVIVSEDPILYPYVTHPGILVVMSQEAFVKFYPGMAEEGLLLYEEDLFEDVEIAKDQYASPTGMIPVKTGKLVAIKEVVDEDELMIMSQNGVLIRVPINGVSVIGRATQGVRLKVLGGGDRVVDVARVISEDA